MERLYACGPRRLPLGLGPLAGAAVVATILMVLVMVPVPVMMVVVSVTRGEVARCGCGGT